MLPIFLPAARGPSIPESNEILKSVQLTLPFHPNYTLCPVPKVPSYKAKAPTMTIRPSPKQPKICLLLAPDRCTISLRFPFLFLPLLASLAACWPWASVEFKATAAVLLLLALLTLAVELGASVLFKLLLVSLLLDS